MITENRKSIGYEFLGILAFARGVAGYRGVDKLGGSLKFSSGPAWDAIDNPEMKDNILPNLEHQKASEGMKCWSTARL